MKHFEITKLPNKMFKITKRNFFYKYITFIPKEFIPKEYNTIETCITHIHKIYYPDECEIKIVA
jgi:hypothetical protein